MERDRSGHEDVPRYVSLEREKEERIIRDEYVVFEREAREFDCVKHYFLIICLKTTNMYYSHSYTLIMSSNTGTRSLDQIDCFDRFEG